MAVFNSVNLANSKHSAVSNTDQCPKTFWVTEKSLATLGIKRKFHKDDRAVLWVKMNDEEACR